MEDSSIWTQYIEQEVSNRPEREEIWTILNKDWNLPDVPCDEQGFVKSFGVNEVEKYLKFFDKYGFVVIKNVLSQLEIENSIEEIWDEIEGNNRIVPSSLTTGQLYYIKAAQYEKDGEPFKAAEFYQKAFRLEPELDDELFAQQVLKKIKPKVNRNDPRTWTSSYWSSSAATGFLGSDVAHGKAAWNNRQNENLYSAFSNIMNRKDLWVSIDRYGIMRPTRNIPKCELPEQRIRVSVEADPDMKTEDEPGWKTISQWTHWDLNPWKWTLNKDDGLPYIFEDFISENNGTKNDGNRKLQGLVSFCDTRVEDGGFCLVPGFHKCLEEWSNLTKDTGYAKLCEAYYTLVSVPDDDPLHGLLKAIPVRAGSLIIWSSEMPHCNYPNDSNRFRMNQYIKMFPAQEEAQGVQERRQLLRRMIPQDAQISPLGEKLLGLKSWN